MNTSEARPGFSRDPARPDTERSSEKLGRCVAVTLIVGVSVALLCVFTKEPTWSQLDKGGNPRTNTHLRKAAYGDERMAPLMEFPGHIYRSLPGVGAFACRDACDKDVRCESWVVGACQVHEDGMQEGVCYLKDQLATSSAFKKCYFFGWDVVSGRCAMKTSSARREPDTRFISGSAEWACNGASLDHGWNYKGTDIIANGMSDLHAPTALECCKHCQRWNEQPTAVAPLLPEHNRCSAFGGISAR